MPRTLAWIFPGQNSRYPAMIEKLIAYDRDNSHWVERASDAVGRDLGRHFRADNAEAFARNRDVQIGVFLANHLHWQNLERAGLRADCSAGLSLGEYNHLVHIGALDFDDAVRLLQARGTEYERGPAGKMAAVFPVTVDEIDPMLRDLDLPDRVGVGMINTPRQLVLSGDAAAVDACAARAEEAFAAESCVVEHALPMHSPLFRAVADRFRGALEAVRWRRPARPYLSNVSGRFELDPSADLFVDRLSRHVCSTVRWRDCVEALASSAPQVTFVETGPKTILTGLFSRKWFSPARFATDAVDDFDVRLDALVEELSNGSGRAAAFTD
ncbi:MAG TPA: ACP S-malonyltransferase [Vicinamibacterales bacterium]|nr:ACP S-malonyltransferase [Vicinamibacterales bacterium]